MTESERLWQEIEAMGQPQEWQSLPSSSKPASFSQARLDPVGIASKVLPEHVGALMVDDWSGLVGRYLRTVKDAEGGYWHELELVAQGPGTALRLGTIMWRQVGKVRHARQDEIERIAA